MFVLSQFAGMSVASSKTEIMIHNSVENWSHKYLHLLRVS